MPLGDAMKKRSGASVERTKGRRRTKHVPSSNKAPRVVARGHSLVTREAKVARLTRERDEALEQQTATSDVLLAISGTPADIQPVFEAMLAHAVRICDAMGGGICRWDGEVLHHVAVRWVKPAFAELLRGAPIYPNPNTNVGRMLTTKTVIHVPDLAAEPAYIVQREPGIVTAVEVGRVRTLLAVPMLKGDELIGAFLLSRMEVRPFTDKQIELVKNFAAQAVIAIENARLLNELRQSLEQQAAASEVLQVIGSSHGDLQPVFATMLEKAVSICDAKFGTLYLAEKGRLRLAAAQQAPRFVEARAGHAFDPVPEGVFDQTIKSKQTVQIVDLAATRGYIERHPTSVEAVELGGIRTVVAAPMLKGGELVGILTISRQEVRPFADKQIAVLTDFAAQAVIAIENARLVSELRQRTTDLTEALEQQTATSELLQVISRSPGDLAPIFATMLANAIRICDATFGDIFRWEDGALRLVTSHETPAAFAEMLKRSPVISPGHGSFTRLMLETKTRVHIADLSTNPLYLERKSPQIAAAVDLGGVRTVLAVPMFREGELIGEFILNRRQVRSFTEKQIELVENFAAQAVIAIENARLLNELRRRTAEVINLNQQLEQRVADQVGEIERMGRLRRFLPPQVADLIVASGNEKQLESHRREITALFCDLRGFTGFTESADAEDVMALLRDYHAAIGEIIIKYNGTLERYAGDGVMVVFNDPVPVENPALQAVLMALELRDALGALTGKWRRFGHDIGYGIGIAHGYATLGTIGFEGRFDYAAIGTVSNVASRLCDEAKPGQILISPRVLVAVENAVRVELVGEFELKGIRRPLAAYNVQAAVPSHQSSDGA
jgi:class 3 adenylate cyclase/putative methionine-R-sulfoxide reductase with GAF domain